jgi:nucleoside-diphosphate-sugar epimerase
MTQQVVVTGGRGVLGAALAAALTADGCRVATIDVRPWSDGAEAAVPAEVPATAAASTSPAHRHVVGDVRDAALLAPIVAGADAVVHCASALPSYPAAQIRSIIVDGTRTVAEVVRRAGVPRLVYISSTSVYGLPDVVPTPEEYPRAPVDAYGAAKVEAESICEQLRAAGTCVPILRPKTFLGPGRMGLFAMLFEWAEEGHGFPLLGGGRCRTQMCALSDVVAAVQAALHAPAAVADDAFNIAAAEFGPLREDFQAVLDAAGHGKRVVSIPAGPAVAVLRVLSALRLSPVYRRLPRKLLADSYVSIDRARERLGFRPRYSGQEAILATYQWWRENRAAVAGRATGRTSAEPWRQGALAVAKAFF